jgi:uncharacterized protein
MRVVFDTNVIISRLLSSGGPPARLFNLWRRQVFDVAVSEAIEVFIAEFRAYAVHVTPTEPIKAVLDDPDDDIFLECAIAADADYIVSGDAHLLALATYRGVRIISPATALVAFAAP